MANGQPLIVGQDNDATNITRIINESGNGGFNVENYTEDNGWGLYAVGPEVGAVGVGKGYGFWGIASEDANAYAGFFLGNVGVYYGNFTVFAGTKSAAVRHPDGSHRLLYAMESPECWFEDFGRARLRRGRVSVKLDRNFAALVRTDSYHVFLTPQSDCNGLYIAKLSRTGFEVRELRKGTSRTSFSYRIVAKRKDVVGARLAKVKPPRFSEKLKKYLPPQATARLSRNRP